MGRTNFTKGITSQGVPFPGITSGNVYFVKEGGSDSADGKSIETARASIDSAMNLVTDGNGDIIYVIGGLSVTTAVTVDKEDTHIIGIPSMDSPTGGRPRLLATDCDGFIIAASKIHIENIRIYVRESAYAGGAPLCGIKVTGTRFHNCIRNVFIQLDAPTGSHGAMGIGISGALANSTIEDVMIQGVHTANSGIATYASGSSRSTLNVIRNCKLVGLMSIGLNFQISSDDVISGMFFGPGLGTGFRVVGTTSVVYDYYTAAATAEGATGTSINGDAHALS